MSFIRTLFSASVGWWLGGPLGAIIGVVINNLIAKNSKVQTFSSESHTTNSAQEGFVASLLVLLAAVMKADGKVVKSELDYVKRYLIAIVGEEKAGEALIVLRDILKKDISVQDVSHQIRVNIDYNGRVQLLHLLFGLAKSDGYVSKAESILIQTISISLGISNSDYESILNMFYVNKDSCYKILEIEPTATDDEVKKAYRKMAVRFHPDKVAHLGEEFQNDAKVKFQKVNEAYNQIKKERGIN